MCDPLNEPEFAVSNLSEHYRSQNYRPEWEQNPALQNWLTQGKNSKRARCTFCDVEMTADICVIKSHSKGLKHRRRVRGEAPHSELNLKAGNYNPKWQLDPLYADWLKPGRQQNKAECSLCDVELRAERTVLKNHFNSKRHARATNHAKRVRDMAQIWVADKKLFSPSNSSPSSPLTEDDSSSCSRLLEQRVAKLTKRSARELKMLPLVCATCQNLLRDDGSGSRVCQVCDGGPSKEQTISLDSCDSAEEVSDGVEAVLGEPLYSAGDEDDTLMYYEVVQHQGTPDDDSRCVIQGLDLSSDVTQLVRVLRSKLSSLNIQINDGHDLEYALTQLHKIVALLDKLKKL